MQLIINWQWDNVRHKLRLYSVQEYNDIIMNVCCPNKNPQ